MRTAEFATMGVVTGSPIVPVAFSMPAEAEADGVIAL